MAMALSSQGSMFTVACMLSIPPRSILVIGIFTCAKIVIKVFIQFVNLKMFDQKRFLTLISIPDMDLTNTSVSGTSN